jgi:hypothetical protein
MQSSPLPEVGNIYISKVDPSMIVLVESVALIDNEPPTHMIEGCDPADQANADGMGFEFLSTEWSELGFIPHTP